MTCVSWGRSAAAFVTERLGVNMRRDGRAPQWIVVGGNGQNLGLIPRADLVATITKKELIDRISEREDCKRVLVKRVIQSFLDSIVEELGNGNRLEFRDFGVFESKVRAARAAQNPKTMDKVQVPSKRTVKFKVGRVMKQRLYDTPLSVDEATGLTVEASAQGPSKHTATAGGTARKKASV